MKKTLSLVLSLLLVFSVFSFACFAKDCNHNYVQTVVVEATCHSTGSKGPKCTKCGDIKYNELVDIPTLAHTVSDKDKDWTVSKKPTYETEGERWTVCTVEGCNAIVTETIPVLSSTCDKHVFGEPILVEKATCTSKSRYEVVCTKCGTHKNRYGDMLAHDERVVKGYAATCEEDGLTDGKICFVCHQWIQEQKRIESKGHLFYTIPDVSYPTCIDKGVGHRFCENCDYNKYVDDIATIAHSDNDKDGLCDFCGDSMKANECNCLCHKNTFISRFIRYLNTLFSNLFDKDFRCCDCMELLEKL